MFNLLFGWMFKIKSLRKHANETSEILLGRWWDILIKIVIPIILAILLIVAIINNVINNPYPDYPGWLIVLMGISPLLIITVLSFVLMKIKGKKGDEM